MLFFITKTIPRRHVGISLWRTFPNAPPVSYVMPADVLTVWKKPVNHFRIICIWHWSLQLNFSAHSSKIHKHLQQNLDWVRTVIVYRRVRVPEPPLSTWPKKSCDLWFVEHVFTHTHTYSHGFVSYTMNTSDTVLWTVLQHNIPLYRLVTAVAAFWKGTHRESPCCWHTRSVRKR